MARLQLTARDITRGLQPELASRARLTLQVYRGQRLERDRPGYPFARRDEPSIRDRASGSIRRTAKGVRIEVSSPGAAYIEGGNGPGEYINAAMAIPLRRKRKAKGRIFIGSDGRAYLGVERVRTFRGQRLLEISARQAYGTRQIRRPALH